MGSKDHDEKSNPNDKKASPLNLQLDPGLKDWRLYEITWNGTLLAHIAAVKVQHVTTTGFVYEPGTEYWEVNTASLTPQSSLTISFTDYYWAERPPPEPGAQRFQSPCAATWQEVTTDLPDGNLYNDSRQGHYVRLVISGSVPNALISKVRWYRKSETAPSASFAPKGDYTAVESVGSGKTWYADSK